MAIAEPKPLSPDQVHERILKLGQGNWVGVQLQNGIAFSGKIVSIDQKGFSVLKYGEPDPTPVFYSEVYSLQTGISVARLRGKPLTLDAIHTRLLKRGLGTWVGVELQNGIVFGGRVVSIDQNSFGMQLYGDPETTPVAYEDVVYLQAGAPQKAFWIIMGVGIGSSIGLALFAHHEMDSMKAQSPTMPTIPTSPVFPVY
jgi:small nuclear ribonucleoprotein (snRNP)-like protein